MLAVNNENLQNEKFSCAKRIDKINRTHTRICNNVKDL